MPVKAATLNLEPECVCVSRGVFSGDEDATGLRKHDGESHTGAYNRNARPKATNTFIKASLHEKHTDTIDGLHTV